MRFRHFEATRSASLFSHSVLMRPFLDSMGFTGFYWVLPGFTRFYRVPLGFTGFYRVSLGFTGFYRVLLVLSDFTEFHRY